MELLNTKDIPSREWLCGWFECYQWKTDCDTHNIIEMSREELWKFYKEIRGI